MTRARRLTYPVVIFNGVKFGRMRRVEFVASISHSIVLMVIAVLIPSLPLPSTPPLSAPPLPSPLPPSPDPLPRTRSDGNAVIYARFPRQGLEEKTCPLGKAFGARRGRRTAYLEPCGSLMAAGLEIRAQGPFSRKEEIF